jgi:magnesium transporter
MQQHTGRRSSKAGLPPGSLVYIGKGEAEAISITVFEYNEEFVDERRITDVSELSGLKDHKGIKWVNVDGLNRVDVLENIGSCFGLHPLVMEDILNTGQRPKAEDYGDYTYIVVKMLSLSPERNGVTIEQQSLVLGRDFVVSFGEKEGDVFEPVRERLRKGVGRIRKLKSDYLAYSLLDAIVDNYFIVLESLGDKIEYAEEELIEKPDRKTLQIIHNLKREMLFLHRSVWPLREVASFLERGESPLIEDNTRVYFRDVYDHTVQVIDTTETCRDMISGMLDIYLSSVSNRMNEVMKVLTVISTLFIPLTFIVGVYGMNFKYLPELEWKWGYYGIWGIMIAIVVFMVTYFKRKKWL